MAFQSIFRRCSGLRIAHWRAPLDAFGARERVSRAFVSRAVTAARRNGRAARRVKRAQGSVRFESYRAPCVVC
eukprot:6021495-Lingulodinium_polyedra.AAC.1